jgi:hypothetical protein
LLTLSFFLSLLPSFLSFFLIVLGVHCGIYKSSFSISNISYLNSSPPSCKLLFLVAFKISYESSLPNIPWGPQAFMLITSTFLVHCHPRHLGYASFFSAPGQVNEAKSSGSPQKHCIVLFLATPSFPQKKLGTGIFIFCTDHDGLWQLPAQISISVFLGSR